MYFLFQSQPITIYNNNNVKSNNDIKKNNNNNNINSNNTDTSIECEKIAATKKMKIDDQGEY